MKNILKKLHIVSNQNEELEGSTSSKGNKSNVVASPEKPSQSQSHQVSEHKPLSALSGWLNSVNNRCSPSPAPPLNVIRGDKMEPSDLMASGGSDMVRADDSASSNSRDANVEEEYQIQLALALSAREDPEAVQIEAVKQISLGSCPPENTPAEILAYRLQGMQVLLKIVCGRCKKKGNHNKTPCSQPI